MHTEFQTLYGKKNANYLNNFYIDYIWNHDVWYNVLNNILKLFSAVSFYFFNMTN